MLFHYLDIIRSWLGSIFMLFRFAARLVDDFLFIQWLEEVGEIRLTKKILNIFGEEEFLYQSYFNNDMERNRIDVSDWVSGRRDLLAKL